MERDLILVDDPHYSRPFQRLGKMVRRVETLFEAPEKFKLVVFTGGEDINPRLYGHRNKFSYFNDERDEREVAMFKQARKYDIPLAGICRGLQFFCAMTGGTLFQHTEGHFGRTGWHMVEGPDNLAPFPVISIHHQMVNLKDPEQSEILLWSMPRLSRRYFGDGGRRVEPPVIECEAAYFRKIKAVGVQYHPEMMIRSDKGFRYFEDLVKLLLNGNSDEIRNASIKSCTWNRKERQ